jgi:hypothetical protein
MILHRSQLIIVKKKSKKPHIYVSLLLATTKKLISNQVGTHLYFCESSDKRLAKYPLSTVHTNIGPCMAVPQSQFHVIIKSRWPCGKSAKRKGPNLILSLRQRLRLIDSCIPHILACLTKYCRKKERKTVSSSFKQALWSLDGRKFGE